jgi:hypothetical protein
MRRMIWLLIGIGGAVGELARPRPVAHGFCDNPVTTSNV